MNIFATSPDPRESAIFLDDKRLVKMCLETAQIICTVLREHYHLDEVPYKSTHINHPCTRWAAESDVNLLWLFRHGLYLCNEYRKIYRRIHKSQKVIIECGKMLRESNYILPIDDSPSNFPNCAKNKEFDIDMTWIKDPHVAYRCYLYERWKHDKRIPTRNKIPINLEY